MHHFLTCHKDEGKTQSSGAAPGISTALMSRWESGDFSFNLGNHSILILVSLAGKESLSVQQVAIYPAEKCTVVVSCWKVCSSSYGAAIE